MAAPQPAYAAEAPVDLGTAASYAVLAGATVTNTGPSVVSGDLGVSPGSAVTGFPPGLVVNGTQHVADAQALQAQSDLTTAYDSAAGRTPVTDVTSDLGGQTLVGGVYRTATSMSLTGTVTLDAQGDPSTVFIFQTGSTLTTASSSSVALVNGTQACNVYWQVGSSATVGTGTTFNGTIMALTSIAVQTGATITGRVLARNGEVTLDTNTLTRPFCAADAPTATPTPTPTSTPADTAATPSGGAGGPGDDDSSTGYFVPEGHPETGLGGTPSPDGQGWVALALIALTAAGLAGAQALRRRRGHGFA